MLDSHTDTSTTLLHIEENHQCSHLSYSILTELSVKFSFGFEHFAVQNENAESIRKHCMVYLHNLKATFPLEARLKEFITALFPPRLCILGRKQLRFI